MQAYAIRSRRVLGQTGWDALYTGQRREATTALGKNTRSPSVER